MPKIIFSFNVLNDIGLTFCTFEINVYKVGLNQAYYVAKIAVASHDCALARSTVSEEEKSRSYDLFLLNAKRKVFC